MTRQLGIGVIDLGWIGHPHSSSYDDLRVLEAANLRDGEQLGPRLAEMLATAHLLDAIERSAETEAWTTAVAEVVG